MDPNEGFMYYRISCTCGKPRLSYDKKVHMYMCRECYSKLERIPIKIAIPKAEQNSTELKEIAEQNDRSEDRDRIDEPEKANTEQRSELQRSESEKTDSNSTELKEITEQNDRSEDRDRIAELEKENSDLKSELQQSKGEISDLNSTLEHMRAKERKMDLVDVSDAMGIILKYMCDVENAAERKGDLEKLKKHLHNLTEITMTNLEGRGITVTAETPGESVSGTVEVTGRVVTDDPSLDGKVESNEGFGCVFKGDAYSRITNSVRIYQYREGARHGTDDSIPPVESADFRMNVELDRSESV